MGKPQHILITGASSGIGAALARHYAKPEVTLSLAGRDRTRLDEIARLCRDDGSEVHVDAFDVTDASAARSWIENADTRKPIGLLVANAGISAGTGGGSETPAQARRIMSVNVDGVANTVHPAIERMRARRSGQIALMSSLAGFIGLPGAPAYCASKASVRVWGEALRGDLAADGIRVSVICPGFVRTPMTDRNPFPMPLLVEPGAAARKIARGLSRNRARIVFPWTIYAAVRLLAAVPPGWRDPMLRRAPRKP